mgnify:FL=1|jgi:hypothetical protein|tara:strand:- start:2242 stop:2451 length:210 start_codon:yes stop_codon:yes gene_type:complete
MDIKQEKEHLVKARVTIEQRLYKMAYIDDCEPMVDLDTACHAVNELEQHMIMTLERINRQQILTESKRR